MDFVATHIIEASFHIYLTFTGTMEGKLYDYVVIGCGGIGSAALYWLSKRAGSGENMLFLFLLLLWWWLLYIRVSERLALFICKTTAQDWLL